MMEVAEMTKHAQALIVQRVEMKYTNDKMQINDYEEKRLQILPNRWKSRMNNHWMNSTGATWCKNDEHVNSRK